MATYKTILRTFLPLWEGFESSPYWDVSRWSWGYGTAVPGAVPDRSVYPGGTISRTQAMNDLLIHVNNDYQYLRPLITRPLTSNQWAAYLSFSYNEGAGNADNLARNINSGDDAALETQWKLYNKVRENGVLVYSQDLADRRAAEWELWAS